jgi:hypothetical protein
MPYIVFCNYIWIAFLIRYALRFMMSCLLGMCSFIQNALCFIFSYRFGIFSPIDVSYALHYQDNLWCVLLFYVSHVCFVLSIGIAFSSDLLYVWYCHIHSGSILLTHVSYVLFCLWPFGYHSPSDVSYDLYFHVNQWCILSSYVLFCLVVYDRFPPSDVSYFLYCHIHLEFSLLSYVSKVYVLSSPFGLRSSTRCIVCFILPCPPGMCYFNLCVFSSFTLFFIRCVIGFIFSFYQGCDLLSYVLFCLFHS